MKRLAAVLAAFALAPPSSPQAVQRPTFSTTANVVVVNVTVTGRDGKPVVTLTKDDFQLYEDGKLQQLQSCELQKLDMRRLPPPAPPALRSRPGSALPATAAPIENAQTLRDHRLIVLLFDLSSMQPAEQIRAAKAAIQFLNTQMTASDSVSIMVFGSELKTLEEFTSDREALIAAIQKLHIGDSSELASMAGTGPDSEDQSGMYSADETEFNIFNTDNKLAALENAARQLGRFPEKKALVYLSSGVEKTGVDNQSQLRATINAAVRANVAFYPIDARGLSALVPGGDASQSGPIGSKIYSGAGQRALKDSFNNQQETLYSLAADTGGKALLDSNDLTQGIRRVQEDISSYYMLTYASANKAEDGRYRRIQVKMGPGAAAPRANLDYRPGYYGPSSFARMRESDKESGLQMALESENPVTALPLAVEIHYFRLSRAKYFVPISVKIPGSALAFRGKGSKQATELDFIAQVRDARGRPASTVRDTIPLNVDERKAAEVAVKQVQYDTGMTLAPGRYKLRFVARENGEGKTRTFDTPFTIPDLGSEKAPRLSSIVLSNQREPIKGNSGAQIAAVKNGAKLIAEDPLIANGVKTVPNVTRVFRDGQDLFVYFELYDPAVPGGATQGFRVSSVAANLAIYRGDRKMLETSAVRASRPDAKRSDTLPMRLQAKLKDLKPGEYVCQVNVIDELGKKFAFPRTQIAVAAPLPAAPRPTP